MAAAGEALKKFFRINRVDDTQLPESFGYVCDVCRSRIKRKDVHYKCTDCVNSFDLCKRCFRNGEGDSHTKENGPQHVVALASEAYFFGPKAVLKPTLEESFLAMFKMYADRHCIGEYSAEMGDYHYRSFSEVLALVHQFYSSLDALLVGLPSRFVALCGNSSLQWYVTDFACILRGVPTVPLGVTVDPGNIAFALNQTEAAIFVIGQDVMDIAFSLLPKCPHIKYVIVLRRPLDEPKEIPAVVHNVTVFTFEDFLKRVDQRKLVPLDKYKLKPEDLLTLVYTSGSTGSPKGCVFTREVYYKRTVERLWQESVVIQVWFSFQPPSHLLERRSAHYTLLKGGKVGIYRGSMEHVFEDIALVRPTLFAATPRFYGVIYDQYRQMVKELTEKYIMEEKGTQSVGSGHEDEALTAATRAVKGANAKYSRILGDRCAVLVTGGAPTGPAVKEFLQNVMTVLTIDGYGTTEAGSVATNGSIRADDFKLVDVPEMGYLTTDDPPRGEVWIKNGYMIKGYYKNEEETADKFQDGYFKTGDIAERRGESIVLIDRKNSIFKLAQGEFVAPSRLEDLFTDGSSFIEQIYIYGNALWTNVVAVVVPFQVAVEKWWQDTKAGPLDLQYEVLCKTEDLRAMILNEVRTISRTLHLPGWEVPVAVLIEPQQFTAENGLLTVTSKPCRPKLEAKYRHILEDLYLQASKKDEEGDKLSVELMFADLVALCFQPQAPPAGAAGHTHPSHLPDLPLHYAESTFTELGGDSIAALQVVSILKRRLRVDVAVDTILNGRVSDVVRYIAHKGDQVVSNSTLFERLQCQHPEVHQRGLSHALNFPAIMHKDRVLEQLLKEKGLTPSVPSESGNGAGTVLLTGCTGFLGRHILLELLNSDLCDRVYCHVRGRDEVEARARLLSLVQMSAVNPASDDSQSNRQLTFDQKVSVVLGDLSQPLLGLKEDTFHSLSKSVDIIIHNGARVNHVLPYTGLRDSNIGSIKELFKLAFNGRPKLFHYVSSLVSLVCTNPSEPRNEDTPWAPMERVTTYTGYGVGYMQTKWVGEHLVLQAAQKGFLRAIISRPALIGPSSVTGLGNQRDWLSLLIRASFDLGVVPLEHEQDYKMLYLVPVDYVARGVLMTSLGVHRGDQRLAVGKCGFPVFHYMNTEHPIKFTDVFGAMAEFDSKLRTTDYFTFRQLLADSVSSPTASEATRKANSVLPTERPPYQGPIMDTWTQLVLHERFGITPPPVDRRVLLLYVQFLVENSKRLKSNVLKSAL